MAVTTTHFKMFLTDAHPSQLAAALNRQDYTLDDRAFVEFDLPGTVTNVIPVFGTDGTTPTDAADPAAEQVASIDPSALSDNIDSSIEETLAQTLVP